MELRISGKLMLSRHYICTRRLCNVQQACNGSRIVRRDNLLIHENAFVSARGNINQALIKVGHFLEHLSPISRTSRRQSAVKSITFTENYDSCREPTHSDQAFVEKCRNIELYITTQCVLNDTRHKLCIEFSIALNVPFSAPPSLSFLLSQHLSCGMFVEFRRLVNSHDSDGESCRLQIFSTSKISLILFQFYSGVYAMTSTWGKPICTNTGNTCCDCTVSFIIASEVRQKD